MDPTPPRCAFVHSPEMDRFRYPPECPFKPERASQTLQRLRSLGLMSGAQRNVVAATPASREQLEAFHTPDYLDELERASAGDLTVEGLHMGLGAPDTPVFKDLFEHACWAAGASRKAADLLLNGEADIAFNLSGGFHHAKAGQASGFCYVNDVVLACLHLVEQGRKVLFIDVDAHHGDGVQEAFYERADVMVMSIHESGKTLFPWGGFTDEIGTGPGEGYTLNLPLPAEVYDEAYLYAFRRAILPVIGAINPDVIVLELGMDILRGDPLTHLEMTNNVHVELARTFRDLGKPLLVAGGGGYHVENTVRGWALFWKTVCDDDEHDMSLGLGGVMLGTSEWEHGLRDRALAVTGERRVSVDQILGESVRAVEDRIFPFFGLVPETQDTPS